MQRHKHYLMLNLPDRSTAVMDTSTLRFYSFDGPQTSWEDTIGQRILADPKAESDGQSRNINFEVLASFIENPQIQFRDSFTRCGPQPRYSFRSAKQEFDVRSLTKVYHFRGSYRGGTFSSSDTEWKFLDGGIISHSGYGWGSHSWTVVEGAAALRVVCLFFGIKQPLRIKGEGLREPLGVLLERMTANDVADGVPVTIFGRPFPSES